MADLADLIFMDEVDKRIFPANMAESVKLAHYAKHIRYICRHYNLGMPRVLGKAGHFQDGPGQTVKLMVWPKDATDGRTFFRVMDASAAMRIPSDEVSFEIVLPKPETIREDSKRYIEAVPMDRFYERFLKITEPVEDDAKMAM